MNNNQKKIFSDNLKKFLARTNLPQSEVAKRIGVSPQTFNTWTQGIAIPRMGKIQLLADFFNVKKSDLIDENKQEKPINPLTTQITKNVEKLTDENKEKTLDYTEELLTEQNNVVPIENYTKVWVVEKASAGTGYSYGDNEGEFMYTDHTLPSYDFATLISGDSMEPKYHDGNVALIRQGYDGINGEIYLIDYAGESYIKKVYNDGDRFRLVSLNREYEDIKIYLSEIDEFTYFNIMGKVIYSFKPVELE